MGMWIKEEDQFTLCVRGKEGRQDEKKGGRETGKREDMNECWEEFF